MVDIHTHILPETDDGAVSWEVATEMCRLAAADGTTHMVATPHANDTYSYDRTRHLERLARLQELAGKDITLLLGCDFHFSYENIQEALINPAQYTINHTRYLLVEFSDYGISPYVGNALLQLRALGVIPVITHPERNVVMQRSPEEVLRLIENGCLVQVTASAFLGKWGHGPQRIAEWLLEREAVHVVASDAHDAVRRPPLLARARQVVAQLRGEDVAQSLFEDNPAAIIHGEEVPFLPAPRPKASRATLW